MEFQAIVMAGGKGTRMTELSSYYPKCLLPVGNKPMIYFPVRMLEKAGFNEINIITNESLKSRIENELKVNCGIKASLNIVGIDDSNSDDDFGTANSLYLLKDKLQHDCMIVSCDLISNVNIQMMSNFYRVNNATFLMLLSDNVEQMMEYPVPGAKGKFAPERDIVGIDTESNRLLYFGAESEVQEIKLKTSIVKKYPKFAWTTKLNDAHFYIMKKCLVDYVIDNKKIFSLKSEFLPYLVKKQFSMHKIAYEHGNKEHQSSNKRAQQPKLFDYLKSNKLSHLINKASITKISQDLLSCYAFVQTDGFCLRANNLAIYAEANRQAVSKILPYYIKERADSIGKQQEKTQTISSDSLVGDGTKVGDKALVKRSVIGRNCQIDEKAKITNSILMDNVKIGESVIVQNSIVCANSELIAKTEIKDCFVGFSQDLLTSGKYSNETIVDNDNFMDD